MSPAENRPVACTLAPEALRERLDSIGRLTHRSLLRHRLEGQTLRLAYAKEAGDEVRRIVDAERECCAFLRFTIEQAADAVILSIEAPDGLGVDARWLFGQFLPHAAEAPACRCADATCAG
jgi:hypothetical protein